MSDQVMPNSTAALINAATMINSTRINQKLIPNLTGYVQSICQPSAMTAAICNLSCAFTRQTLKSSRPQEHGFGRSLRCLFYHAYGECLSMRFGIRF